MATLVWLLLLDVAATQNQTTTGIATTPAPSSDSGLAWWAILLIVMGSIGFVVLLGLLSYNTFVARKMDDKMKPADSASGAYVKVIQVDLVHA